MTGIFLASSLLACLVMATLLQSMNLANQEEEDLANQEEDLANQEEETSQNSADKMTSNKDCSEDEARRESVPKPKQLLITATVRQMSNREQLLLIPLTLWCGVEQGFFGADFTAVTILSLQFLATCGQAFVTCTYGVHTVGLVLVFSGKKIVHN